jgi:hypothetical protein
MVGLGPDVIFTSGFSTIRPLLDATSTLPIVFARAVPEKAESGIPTGWRI